jgi:hypothetical protein
MSFCKLPVLTGLIRIESSISMGISMKISAPSALLLAVACQTVMAAEVVLYDCDYTALPALMGQSIPLASSPLPGRTACGEIIFGAVEIGTAPSPWSGTAAFLKPAAVGSFHYSQMQFVMLTGSVYAFRKHRIEMTFQMPSAPSNLNIFTDGGVTSYLGLSHAGQAAIETHTGPSDNPVGQHQQLPPFDATQPVHLVWETDIDGTKTMVTLNGNATTIPGLTPNLMGLRNWQGYPGPIFIRLNLSAADTHTHLALRSIRIIGDDYDGPLFVEPDGEVSEHDVATVPFQAPESGTWQPQFSIDGQQWKNYAQPVDADFPFSAISFGRRVSPTMFFRLQEVTD